MSDIVHVQGEFVISNGNSFTNKSTDLGSPTQSRTPVMRGGDFDLASLAGAQPGNLGPRGDDVIWMGDDEMDDESSESSDSSSSSDSSASSNSSSSSSNSSSSSSSNSSSSSSSSTS